MNFSCKFTPDDSLQKLGATKYIRCPDFDAPKMFASFDIIGKRVGRSDQETMLDEMLNDDGGWTAFVCSAPEYGRLFAYQMMKRYLDGDGARIEWHRVTGSR